GLGSASPTEKSRPSRPHPEPVEGRGRGNQLSACPTSWFDRLTMRSLKSLSQYAVAADSVELDAEFDAVAGARAGHGLGGGAVFGAGAGERAVEHVVGNGLIDGAQAGIMRHIEPHQAFGGARRIGIHAVEQQIAEARLGQAMALAGSRLQPAGAERGTDA